ncbi:MAG TPA: glycosyltransferase family 4 protein [Daejeonella sp.]|nr:glycosyltransferase family 4 protein [Daejeonella sp.]
MCRIVSRVLFDMSFQLSRFKVFSMYDRPAERDSRYIDRPNFKAFTGHRTQFIISAAVTGIRSDVVILSHINLLLVAAIIKFFSPQTRIIIYAHGTELWRSIRKWKSTFLKKNCEIWAVSSYTAQKLQDLYQVDSRQITILPNCLNPYLEIPKSFIKPANLLYRYHLHASQPVIFTLARLSSHDLYKGYDLVIECLPELIKSFPSIHYLLAGKADEKEKDRLQALIRKLGLETHITLTGFLPEEEISKHFLLADVFIMPSRKEGFGIVFIEAAACGCKVIGGNQDGSVQALLDGKLGTLVHPEEKQSIIKAIRKNLNHPRTETEAQAIQKLCIEHFNYQAYFQKIQKLLVPQE